MIQMRLIPWLWDPITCPSTSCSSVELSVTKFATAIYHQPIYLLYRNIFIFTIFCFMVYTKNLESYEYLHKYCYIHMSNILASSVIAAILLNFSRHLNTSFNFGVNLKELTWRFFPSENHHLASRRLDPTETQISDRVRQAL